MKRGRGGMAVSLALITGCVGGCAGALPMESSARVSSTDGPWFGQAGRVLTLTLPTKNSFGADDSEELVYGSGYGVSPIYLGDDLKLYLIKQPDIHSQSTATYQLGSYTPSSLKVKPGDTVRYHFDTSVVAEPNWLLGGTMLKTYGTPPLVTRTPVLARAGS